MKFFNRKKKKYAKIIFMSHINYKKKNLNKYKKNNEFLTLYIKYVNKIKTPYHMESLNCYKIKSLTIFIFFFLYI